MKRSRPFILIFSALLCDSWLPLSAGDIPEPAKPAAKPLVSKAVATNRIASLPDYARPLDESVAAWGGEGEEAPNWLDFGIESRSRFEFRDQDYRTTDLISEEVFYQRSLVYLGIHDLLDPFRVAVEFEDARRGLSLRPESANEANHTELLQGYGELYLDDAVNDEALSLRFGRMAFDSIDRRLISRNRYRNTINAFDGARLRIGDEKSPIEWDTFALRTVDRSVDALDRSGDDSLLYGITGYLRTASPELVLEPYWLLADQSSGTGKKLHTSGLHAYGLIGGSGWDYDIDIVGQWGVSAGLDHSAWAAHAEAGYSWDHPWKPRLSGWLNYATGDRDPLDSESGRFDPLYGATFAFYGYTSYFSWQNMINPAVRLSFLPHAALRCEIIHRGVWLASERDAWTRGSRSDATGGSGRYVGQELDLRAAYRVNEHLEIEAVFSRFFPGDFVEATGASPASNFGYVAATLRF
jgi:hypothetical protein